MHYCQCVDAFYLLLKSVDNAVMHKYSDIKEILADLIKNHPNGGGNRTELAKKINEKFGDGTIDQSTVQRIASGQNKDLKYMTVKILADYFNLSTEQLMGFKPIKKDNVTLLPVKYNGGLRNEDFVEIYANLSHSLESRSIEMTLEDKIEAIKTAIKACEKTGEVPDKKYFDGLLDFASRS